MDPLCISFCFCGVVYLPNIHDQSQGTYGVVDRAYRQLEDITHEPEVNKLIFDEKSYPTIYLDPILPEDSTYHYPLMAMIIMQFTPYAASTKPPTPSISYMCSKKMESV